MKSIWINLSLLILPFAALGQLPDSSATEDVYQLDVSDDNIDNGFSIPHINVNNALQIKRLPKHFQDGIAQYKSQFGCITNLFELFRIPNISASQWDSIIPLLTCGPCLEKPKFIDQTLTLTVKEIPPTVEVSDFSKYNVRYKGTSENGFRWGFHHFVSEYNEQKRILNSAYVQFKNKKHHIILGNFLPQTPLNMLFGNNLMRSSAWSVNPLMGNNLPFVPYTSSISNRHWQGVALSKTLRNITLNMALDQEKPQPLAYPKQLWWNIEWRNTKYKLQYHQYSNISDRKKTTKNALIFAGAFGKNIVQSELIHAKNKLSLHSFWIQPIFKNQWMRISHRAVVSTYFKEEEWVYVHQIFFHKKLKGLVSWINEKNSGPWENHSHQEQAIQSHIDFTPTRYHNFYVRYQIKKSPEMMRQWRMDGKWKVNENIQIHCRIEQHSNHAKSGWLSAMEYEWKPMDQPWQVIIRQVFFTVPDWDLRIYMMDRELRGGMSIPAYSGKGKRTFCIVQYHSPHLIWAFKIEREQVSERGGAITNHQADVQLTLTI